MWGLEKKDLQSRPIRPTLRTWDGDWHRPNRSKGPDQMTTFNFATVADRDPELAKQLTDAAAVAGVGIDTIEKLLATVAEVSESRRRKSTLNGGK